MFVLHWDQTKCPVYKRCPDLRVSTFRGSTVHISRGSEFKVGGPNFLVLYKSGGEGVQYKNLKSGIEGHGPPPPSSAYNTIQYSLADLGGGGSSIVLKAWNEPPLAKKQQQKVGVVGCGQLTTRIKITPPPPL